MRLIQTVVVVLVCSLVALAQSNQGGISGTVFDQNEAVVPGATVIITNLGTSQTTTLTTSESGVYSIRSLEPVTYSVQSGSSGFQESDHGKGEG